VEQHIRLPVLGGEGGRMIAYITKYALSGVIRKAEGKADANGVFRINGEFAGYWPADWRPDFQAAVKRANEMRAKKITSLKKQIAKLESMTFEEAVCF
jgi:hypothetical protein